MAFVPCHDVVGLGDGPSHLLSDSCVLSCLKGHLNAVPLYRNFGEHSAPDSGGDMPRFLLPELWLGKFFIIIVEKRDEALNPSHQIC
jgi:hypothetical protein